ncbi:MAG: exopolyphosphatase [Planctomycetaceae bacterium]|nr:exopolyphosphatase [Planctomycetaceae bacterium]
MSTAAAITQPVSTSPPSVRSVAVIDVGTTAIRMEIAEIDSEGAVRTLEGLAQAVSLGRDTFTKGRIEKSTIEECVNVLGSYKQRLREYQINDDDQIRVVATSAVREAENRLAFLDRIYIATGIQIEPIDEATVNRITYLGIQPFLKAERLREASAVVIEVGGGSTEALFVRNGQVYHSYSYRLGSVRLRKMLEARRTPSVKVRDVMQNQIVRTVEQISMHVSEDDAPQMIAIGGDVRFAARQLNISKEEARIDIQQLEEFTDQVLSLTTDQLVQRYHLTYPDAETLGPALLTYVMLARDLKMDEVLVTNTSLRHGLLNEMIQREESVEFNQQIIRSAIDLGRRYDFDESHAVHVAEMSKQLFQSLQKEHNLDHRYELILYVSALLHEIGMFVSMRSFHKHTMYLIGNSELFGLSEQDVQIVSLVARYHRRAAPKPNHQGYESLDREGRIVVAKLAAMLRCADALDNSHSQRIETIDCSIENGRLTVTVPNVEDLSLEQMSITDKGSLFEDIFGKSVLLRASRISR